MNKKTTDKPAEKKKAGGALARLSRNAEVSASKDAPVVQIMLEKILFNPKQPRQAFHAFDGVVSQIDQEALKELACSIKSHGLIHPVTVSEQPDGRYLVQVGERRTRACMLNGDTTILARVRNDLDGMLALALQMAENTDRLDLTDREIADTIGRLLTKSDENPHPMNKTEVATILGKTPGWLTRYVTFADEILRQKWVAPGYVLSPEVLYQVARLPDNIADLLYAALSTGKTPTPLRSGALAFYQELAKRQKAGEVIGGEPETVPVGDGDGDGSGTEAMPSSQGGDTLPFVPDNDGSGGDGQTDDARARAVVIDAALNNDGSSDVAPDSQTGEYRVPEELVKELRKPTFGGGDSAGTGAPLSSTPRMMAASAVPCRLPVTALKNLLEKYGDTLGDIGKLDAEVRFPSGMAVLLVRELTGEDWEEDRVASILAKALEKMSS